MMAESCVVGVQLGPSRIAKAFRVRISDACEVFVNYWMPGISRPHTSYHASGQQHKKAGGNYIGEKLNAMPPKEVITRVACQDSIAWNIADLSGTLHTLAKRADMIVDARGLSKSALLLFKISVVGGWAREPSVRPGFARIKSHRFGTRVQVEIEAFEAAPSSPTIV